MELIGCSDPVTLDHRTNKSVSQHVANKPQRQDLFKYLTYSKSLNKKFN